MIPNMQGEESHADVHGTRKVKSYKQYQWENKCFTLNQQHCSPFAEFLERRSDHTPTFNDTVAPDSDISEISSDDTVIHHDSLKEEAISHS